MSEKELLSPRGTENHALGRGISRLYAIWNKIRKCTPSRSLPRQQNGQPRLLCIEVKARGRFLPFHPGAREAHQTHFSQLSLPTPISLSLGAPKASAPSYTAPCGAVQPIKEP